MIQSRKSCRAGTYLRIVSLTSMIRSMFEQWSTESWVSQYRYMYIVHNTCIDNTYMYIVCGLRERTDIDISSAVIILNIHYNCCKARMARTVHVCTCMYTSSIFLFSFLQIIRELREEVEMLKKQLKQAEVEHITFPKCLNSELYKIYDIKKKLFARHLLVLQIASEIVLRTIVTQWECIGEEVHTIHVTCTCMYNIAIAIVLILCVYCSMVERSPFVLYPCLRQKLKLAERAVVPNVELGKQGVKPLSFRYNGIVFCFCKSSSNSIIFTKYQIR